MKIEEQVLSIEQMKHLQELGVDTSDASMCWLRYDVGGVVKLYMEINDKKCIEMYSATPYPTYTIGDLIEKLPEELKIEHKVYCREIIIFNDLISVSYYNNVEVKLLFSIDNTDDKKSTLIKLLYKTLCWVAENHKELLEVKND